MLRERGLVKIAYTPTNRFNFDALISRVWFSE